MRIRRLIGWLVLATCVGLPAAARADGPKTRYERVLAQEDELRLGRKPSPLSQIRRVVAAYEAVVRRYPTSGYSDNALFQAAELSIRANQIYRSDVDRQTAVRMLKWLVDQYPDSSLRDKARQLLRQTRGAETSVASAKTTTRVAPGAAPANAAATAAAARTAQARPAPTDNASTSGGHLNVVSMPPPLPASAAAPADAPRSMPAAMSSDALDESARPVLLRSVKRTAIDDLVRVTLEFDGEVTYTQERIEGPARLFFDMRKTSTAATLRDATLTYADESVRHIRLGRPKPDVTRLVIDLTGTDGYSVFSLYNPYRLTIDLHRAKSQPSTLVAKAIDTKPQPLASRVTSVAAARVVEPERPIQPRPLPYPLADSTVAVRFASRDVTEDIEASRPLQPHPLPHPLARVPTSPRVAPRAVARYVAPPPILVPNRMNVPLTMSPLRTLATTHVAAAFLTKPAVAGAAIARNTPPAAASKPSIASRRSLKDIARETPPPPPSPSAKKAAGADVTETVDAANAVVPGVPSTLPPPAPPSANNGGNYSIARQLGLGVSRIVIDPGHGGHDPGALGSKINESEVVLDVALRLEKLLQNERNFDVVLTRRTDVFIPLEERTAIANREHADLFLSIHANSSRNKQAHGIETYHLNFASNPEAEQVAARENAGAAQTMNHLPEIVKAIALNNKLDESRDFAHMVQESMSGRLKAQNEGLRDLGVKQAPFVVLIGAGMPSVLAEVAFISNSNEAALLRTGAYRQKIAEALFDAVKKYQKTLKTVGTVATQIAPLDDDR
jgi:N-acetylmuramoyl-L-alanine amidase